MGALHITGTLRHEVSNRADLAVCAFVMMVEESGGGGGEGVLVGSPGLLFSPFHVPVVQTGHRHLE